MDNPGSTNQASNSGNSATTDQGQAATIGQLQAQLNGLSQSLNEALVKFNSLSEAVKKNSVNDDNNLETSVVGVHDPFDEVRRSYVQRDQIFAISVQALTKMVENGDMLMKRSLDHFAVLQPMSSVTKA
jgi:hypothetical protein